MDGKSFLGTARFLQNKGTDEAAYRSAISRAYYACFIAIRDVAFKACESNARRIAGIKSERTIRHEPLQRYLKSGSLEAIRRLGEDLAALQGSRTDADYNMTLTISTDDAQSAIGEAEAFLKALSRTSVSDIGKAMADNINETY